MRCLSANMHRGQRMSAGNRADDAIKAEYKRAADLFTKQRKFFLLSGRHPYKSGVTTSLKPLAGKAITRWVMDVD